MSRFHIVFPQHTQVGGRWPLGVVIVLAVAIRLVVAISLGDRAQPVSGAWDQLSYDVLAQRLVDGHGFSFPDFWYPFTYAEQPTAHWSYLYTIYLAVVYAVAGHHPLAARLVQAVLSGLLCLLTYRIARHLFKSDWAGLAAALLAALYAYFVFFAAALMTQTFYIVTLLAAFDLAFGLARRPTRSGLVVLGIVLAAGVLLRQTMLLFTPVLLVWLWWAGWGRIRWRDLLIPVVTIAVLILPWTVYNYLRFDDFLLLNSNGGFWLYSSNHPHQGVDFDSTYVAPIPEHLEGKSEAVIDRALYGEGLGFIVSDPQRFLRLTLSRVDDYFWVLPSDQSTLMSNLGRALSLPVYLPFMLAGLLLSFRYWQVCLPLYLYVVFDTTLHLLTWAAPRYRLPSDALMIIMAGLAVAHLVQAVAARVQSWKSRAMPAQTGL